LPFNNPNLFTAADRDWTLGVDAVYSDNGTHFDQSFEQILSTLYWDFPQIEQAGSLPCAICPI